MSCISSNFSSFFLNSLNDPSEFAKYLSNGEMKFSSFEDIQVFGGSPPNGGGNQHQQQYSTHPQHILNGGHGNSHGANITVGGHNNNHHQHEIYAGDNSNSMHMDHSGLNGGGTTTPQPQQHNTNSSQYVGQQQHIVNGSGPSQTPNPNFPHHPQQQPLTGSNSHQSTPTPANSNQGQRWPNPSAHPNHGNNGGGQHFDGSFEFIKYLRHSNDFTSGTNGQNCDSNSNDNHMMNGNSSSSSSNSSNGPLLNPHQQQAPIQHQLPQQLPLTLQQQQQLMDLDNGSPQKPRPRQVAALMSSVPTNSPTQATIDVFDHDSKHTIFDLNPHNSNSNESCVEMSSVAYTNSHLNASNSNTSSEGAAAGNSEFANASSVPKTLATFTMKENFDVHPSHKVEEGIFQHMNKLPAKKKETLKQLGVRFTGQMTLSDKTIVVDNFIKFCQEYDIKDHRPFLSLNQSGLNKPEQIKFARYLGQGLPTFTLFCIYSNFKNLFCTKRTEMYTKDGYNLPYILEKTKRFLANTTAGGTPGKTIPTAPPCNGNGTINPTNVPQQQNQPQSQQQEQPLQPQQQPTQIATQQPNIQQQPLPTEQNTQPQIQQQQTQPIPQQGPPPLQQPPQPQTPTPTQQSHPHFISQQHPQVVTQQQIQLPHAAHMQLQNQQMQQNQLQAQKQQLQQQPQLQPGQNAPQTPQTQIQNHIQMQHQQQQMIPTQNQQHQQQSQTMPQNQGPQQQTIQQQPIPQQNTIQQQPIPQQNTIQQQPIPQQMQMHPQHLVQMQHQQMTQISQQIQNPHLPQAQAPATPLLNTQQHVAIQQIHHQQRPSQPNTPTTIMPQIPTTPQQQANHLQQHPGTPIQTMQFTQAPGGGATSQPQPMQTTTIVFQQAVGQPSMQTHPGMITLHTGNHHPNGTPIAILQQNPNNQQPQQITLGHHMNNQPIVTMVSTTLPHTLMTAPPTMSMANMRPPAM